MEIVLALQMETILGNSVAKVYDSHCFSPQDSFESSFLNLTTFNNGQVLSKSLHGKFLSSKTKKASEYMFLNPKNHKKNYVTMMMIVNTIPTPRGLPIQTIGTSCSESSVFPLCCRDDMERDSAVTEFLTCLETGGSGIAVSTKQQPQWKLMKFDYERGCTTKITACPKDGYPSDTKIKKCGAGASVVIATKNKTKCMLPKLKKIQKNCDSVSVENSEAVVENRCKQKLLSIVRWRGYDVFVNNPMQKQDAPPMTSDGTVDIKKGEKKNAMVIEPPITKKLIKATIHIMNAERGDFCVIEEKYDDGKSTFTMIDSGPVKNEDVFANRRSNALKRELINIGVFKESKEPTDDKFDMEGVLVLDTLVFSHQDVDHIQFFFNKLSRNIKIQNLFGRDSCWISTACYMAKFKATLKSYRETEMYKSEKDNENKFECKSFGNVSNYYEKINYDKAMWYEKSETVANKEINARLKHGPELIPQASSPKMDPSYTNRECIISVYNQPGGKNKDRCIIGGDATGNVIIALRELMNRDGGMVDEKIKCKYFKALHHGSRKNNMKTDKIAGLNDGKGTQRNFKIILHTIALCTIILDSKIETVTPDEFNWYRRFRDFHPSKDEDSKSVDYASYHKHIANADWIETAGIYLSGQLKNLKNLENALTVGPLNISTIIDDIVDVAVAAGYKCQIDRGSKAKAAVQPPWPILFKNAFVKKGDSVLKNYFLTNLMYRHLSINFYSEIECPFICISCCDSFDMPSLQVISGIILANSLHGPKEVTIFITNTTTGLLYKKEILYRDLDSVMPKLNGNWATKVKIFQSADDNIRTEFDILTGNFGYLNCSEYEYIVPPPIKVKPMKMLIEKTKSGKKVVDEVLTSLNKRKPVGRTSYADSDDEIVPKSGVKKRNDGATDSEDQHGDSVEAELSMALHGKFELVAEEFIPMESLDYNQLPQLSQQQFVRQPMLSLENLIKEAKFKLSTHRMILLWFLFVDSIFMEGFLTKLEKKLFDNLVLLSMLDGVIDVEESTADFDKKSDLSFDKLLWVNCVVRGGQYADATGTVHDILRSVWKVTVVSSLHMKVEIIVTYAIGDTRTYNYTVGDDSNVEKELLPLIYETAPDELSIAEFVCDLFGNSTGICSIHDWPGFLLQYAAYDWKIIVRDSRAIFTPEWMTDSFVGVRCLVSSTEGVDISTVLSSGLMSGLHSSIHFKVSNIYLHIFLCVVDDQNVWMRFNSTLLISSEMTELPVNVWFPCNRLDAVRLCFASMSVDTCSLLLKHLQGKNAPFNWLTTSLPILGNLNLLDLANVTVTLKRTTCGNDDLVLDGLYCNVVATKKAIEIKNDLLKLLGNRFSSLSDFVVGVGVTDILSESPNLSFDIDFNWEVKKGVILPVRFSKLVVTDPTKSLGENNVYSLIVGGTSFPTHIVDAIRPDAASQAVVNAEMVQDRSIPSLKDILDCFEISFENSLPQVSDVLKSIGLRELLVNVQQTPLVVVYLRFGVEFDQFCFSNVPILNLFTFEKTSFVFEYSRNEVWSVRVKTTANFKPYINDFGHKCDIEVSYSDYGESKIFSFSVTNDDPTFYVGTFLDSFTALGLVTNDIPLVGQHLHRIAVSKLHCQISESARDGFSIDIFELTFAYDDTLNVGLTLSDNIFTIKYSKKYSTFFSLRSTVNESFDMTLNLTVAKNKLNCIGFVSANDTVDSVSKCLKMFDSRGSEIDTGSLFESKQDFRLVRATVEFSAVKDEHGEYKLSCDHASIQMGGRLTVLASTTAVAITDILVIYANNKLTLHGMITIGENHRVDVTLCAAENSRDGVTVETVTGSVTLTSSQLPLLLQSVGASSEVTSKFNLTQGSIEAGWTLTKQDTSWMLTQLLLEVSCDNVNVSNQPVIDLERANFGVLYDKKKNEQLAQFYYYVSGVVNLCGVKVQALYQVTEEKLIAVRIRKNSIKSLQLNGLVNQLQNYSTSEKDVTSVALVEAPYKVNIVPSNDFEFLASLNLTRERFLFYGSYNLVGKGIFYLDKDILEAPVESSTQGVDGWETADVSVSGKTSHSSASSKPDAIEEKAYLFAAQTADNFTFSDLFAGSDFSGIAASIDSVLKINKAMVCVSTFKMKPWVQITKNITASIDIFNSDNEMRQLTGTDSQLDSLVVFDFPEKMKLEIKNQKFCFINCEIEVNTTSTGALKSLFSFGGDATILKLLAYFPVGSTNREERNQAPIIFEGYLVGKLILFETVGLENVDITYNSGSINSHQAGQYFEEKFTLSCTLTLEWMSPKFSQALSKCSVEMGTSRTSFDAIMDPSVSVNVDWFGWNIFTISNCKFKGTVFHKDGEQKTVKCSMSMDVLVLDTVGFELSMHFDGFQPIGFVIDLRDKKLNLFDMLTRIVANHSGTIDSDISIVDQICGVADGKTIIHKTLNNHDVIYASGAYFTIDFFDAFRVQVSIKRKENGDSEISGRSMKPVDFGFVQLGFFKIDGSKVNYGPMVQYTGKQTSHELALLSQIQIGEYLLEMQAKYKSENSELEGTVALENNKSLSIGIMWNKKLGLRWNLGNLEAVSEALADVKFVKSIVAFINVLNFGVCESVVGFLFDTVNDLMGKSGIFTETKPSYKFDVGSKKITVGLECVFHIFTHTVNTGKLEVESDEITGYELINSLASMAEFLAAQVIKLIPKFWEAIQRDTGTFLKIISALGSKKMIKGALSTLVCKFLGLAGFSTLLAGLAALWAEIGAVLIAAAILVGVFMLLRKFSKDNLDGLGMIDIVHRDKPNMPALVSLLQRDGNDSEITVGGVDEEGGFICVSFYCITKAWKYRILFTSLVDYVATPYEFDANPAGGEDGQVNQIITIKIRSSHIQCSNSAGWYSVGVCAVYANDVCSNYNTFETFLQRRGVPEQVRVLLETEGTQQQFIINWVSTSKNGTFNLLSDKMVIPIETNSCVQLPVPSNIRTVAIASSAEEQAALAVVDEMAPPPLHKYAYSATVSAERLMLHGRQPPYHWELCLYEAASKHVHLTDKNIVVHHMDGERVVLKAKPSDEYPLGETWVTPGELLLKIGDDGSVSATILTKFVPSLIDVAITCSVKNIKVQTFAWNIDVYKVVVPFAKFDKLSAEERIIFFSTTDLKSNSIVQLASVSDLCCKQSESSENLLISFKPPSHRKDVQFSVTSSKKLFLPFVCHYPAAIESEPEPRNVYVTSYDEINDVFTIQVPLDILIMNSIGMGAAIDDIFSVNVVDPALSTLMSGWSNFSLRIFYRPMPPISVTLNISIDGLHAVADIESSTNSTLSQFYCILQNSASESGDYTDLEAISLRSVGSVTFSLYALAERMTSEKKYYRVIASEYFFKDLMSTSSISNCLEQLSMTTKAEPELYIDSVRQQLTVKFKPSDVSASNKRYLDFVDEKGEVFIKPMDGNNSITVAVAELNGFLSLTDSKRVAGSLFVRSFAEGRLSSIPQRVPKKLVAPSAIGFSSLVDDSAEFRRSGAVEPSFSLTGLAEGSTYAVQFLPNESCVITVCDLHTTFQMVQISTNAADKLSTDVAYKLQLTTKTEYAFADDSDPVVLGATVSMLPVPELDFTVDSTDLVTCTVAKKRTNCSLEIVVWCFSSHDTSGDPDYISEVVSAGEDGGTFSLDLNFEGFVARYRYRSLSDSFLSSRVGHTSLSRQTTVELLLATADMKYVAYRKYDILLRFHPGKEKVFRVSAGEVPPHNHLRLFEPFVVRLDAVPETTKEFCSEYDSSDGGLIVTIHGRDNAIYIDGLPYYAGVIVEVLDSRSTAVKSKTVTLPMVVPKFPGYMEITYRGSDVSISELNGDMSLDHIGDNGHAYHNTSQIDFVDKSGQPVTIVPIVIASVNFWSSSDTVTRMVHVVSVVADVCGRLFMTRHTKNIASTFREVESHFSSISRIGLTRFDGRIWMVLLSKERLFLQWSTGEFNEINTLTEVTTDNRSVDADITSFKNAMYIGRVGGDGNVYVGAYDPDRMVLEERKVAIVDNASHCSLCPFLGRLYIACTDATTNHSSLLVSDNGTKFYPFYEVRCDETSNRVLLRQYSGSLVLCYAKPDGGLRVAKLVTSVGAIEATYALCGNFSCFGVAMPNYDVVVSKTSGAATLAGRIDTWNAWSVSTVAYKNSIILMHASGNLDGLVYWSASKSAVVENSDVSSLIRVFDRMSLTEQIKTRDGQAIQLSKWRANRLHLTATDTAVWMIFSARLDKAIHVYRSTSGKFDEDAEGYAVNSWYGTDVGIAEFKGAMHVVFVSVHNSLMFSSSTQSGNFGGGCAGLVYNVKACSICALNCRIYLAYVDMQTGQLKFKVSSYDPVVRMDFDDYPVSLTLDVVYDVISVRLATKGSEIVVTFVTSDHVMHCEMFKPHH